MSLEITVNKFYFDDVAKKNLWISNYLRRECEMSRELALGMRANNLSIRVSDLRLVSLAIMFMEHFFEVIHDDVGTG